MDLDTERFASNDVSINFGGIANHWYSYEEAAADDGAFDKKSNDTIRPNNCVATETSNPATAATRTRYFSIHSSIAELFDYKNAFQFQSQQLVSRPDVQSRSHRLCRQLHHRNRSR